MAYQKRYETDANETKLQLMFGLREAKLTVLDDLAIERGTDWVQEKLYELIDPRYRARQPTVGTTNAGPKALEEQIGRRAPPGL